MLLWSNAMKRVRVTNSERTEPRTWEDDIYDKGQRVSHTCCHLSIYAMIHPRAVVVEAVVHDIIVSISRLCVGDAG